MRNLRDLIAMAVGGAALHVGGKLARRVLGSDALVELSYYAPRALAPTILALYRVAS